MRAGAHWAPNGFGQPAGAPALGAALGQRNTANSVIVNPEGGLIAVRAARQHEKIAQFLDVVLGAAKRQVLIEATIIEVKLSNAYQQGINWSNLAGGGPS
jgi:general secretion pathway protein D